MNPTTQMEEKTILTSFLFFIAEIVANIITRNKEREYMELNQMNITKPSDINSEHKCPK